MKTRFVSAAGAELAVTEHGAGAPTLVLLHGYPDTAGVWDEVVEALRDRFRIVTYDMRGTGRSRLTNGAGRFELSQLADDLASVLEAVCPDERVHLVGHDWGSFTCWAALAGGAVDGRVASFTSIAGPRLDHSGAWLRRRLRRGPAGLGEVAGQAVRSWYVSAFQIPALPERALSGPLGRRFASALARAEGFERRPGHPADTIARDAAVGLALYRTNMRRNIRGTPAPPTTVPVQLIVPTRDRYISPALYAEADSWAERVWRRDINAGHWVQRTHPELVARWIAEHAELGEAGAESEPMRRAALSSTELPLHGRLAVVTGAGSGIGRATALALAAQGAEIVGADIDLETAEQTAERIRAEHSGYARADLLDVSDRAAMEEFAKAIERDLGTPEIVVNNAGIGLGGPFLETSAEDWERVVGVNLWGVIHGSRLFAKLMADTGTRGHIFNVASAAAFTPSRALPAYSTTKAAVLMLSECMRAELAGRQIRVTAVCPGVIDTNIARDSKIVGVDEGELQRLQALGSRAMRLRGYAPDRVASAIVTALRSNPAVITVTPEARAARAMSRVSPAAMRAIARVDVSRFV